MASIMQRSAIGSRAGVRPSLRTSVARRTFVAAAASVKELNEKFGIAGAVSVVEGKSGSTMVTLKHACGSSAEIYLHGACVTSWKQASGDEVLFVRPDAVFDKSKPISGGIPHCFPQFGPGAIQQHGFARNSDWAIASTSADPNPDEKDPSVELVLTENDYTLKMWPFKFKAVYNVTLHGELLQTDLKIHNTDDKPFEFTAGLHTYIEVLGIELAKVKGLKGLKFLDKSKDPSKPEERIDEADAITFDSYMDRVYLNSPDHVELDVGTGAAVAIDSTGWEDSVVWNPWTTMEACYKNFVCVENVQFGKPATVKPGETWSATANFNVQDSK
mmetsp:Transcript_45075/g.134552  ORF Transcript_45075/g.134552 Transcript_45075/m.134552 type:complete len:330 (-) Transcript_45075:661-1650(-)